MRRSEGRPILRFFPEPVHNAGRDAEVVRPVAGGSGDQVIRLHGPEEEVVAVGNVYPSAKPTRTAKAGRLNLGVANFAQAGARLADESATIKTKAVPLMGILRPDQEVEGLHLTGEMAAEI